MPDPEVPQSEVWSIIEQLKHEKEVTGMYITGHPLDNFKLELKNIGTIEKIESSRNRKTSFAGIVTDSKHKLDKKGRRFGVFTVEDYSGSKEFALFNEDYLKFKHFLVVGELLYVTGIYQARYNSTDLFEFKIHDIELLQEIRNKKTKRVVINLALSKLSDKVIEDLVLALQSNPGKFEVTVDVFDHTESSHLPMTSMKYKVELTQDMVTFLQNFEFGDCRLIMN
jgi:DNA polymerase-3 subunit alpha